MRTIYWYLAMFFSTVFCYPKLKKAEKLQDSGRTEEFEAFVYDCTTKFMKANFKRTGSKVEVVGTENIPKDRTVLIVSNHQGNFDIPLLMSFIDIPKGFIAKIELANIPIISRWMELMHSVFMDRSSLKGAGAAIMQGIRELKQGHNMVIFPEGTRSKSGKIGEFKHASFKLATKPGVTILPVTLDGTYNILEKNGFKIKPANIRLTIHEPIETKGMSKEEQEALPDQVFEIIKSALSEIQ